MHSRLSRTTEERESLDHRPMAKLRRITKDELTNWSHWSHSDHHIHIHINLPKVQMTQTNSPIAEPKYTYESLEKELYHKGHGSSMDKRKVGNHTHLIRLDNRIAVKLHDTNILIFWPDGRVVLDASHWTTVTTKDRMNAFLEWNTVESFQGAWYVNARFRIYNATHMGYEYVDAKVPFSNGMVLDVRTHELVSSPTATFTRVDDSIIRQEARDLVGLLNVETESLIRLTDSKLVTNDDIGYAVKLAEKFQAERKRVTNQLESLDSRMDWAVTHLEDAIGKAIRLKGDTEYMKRANVQGLFKETEHE
jgi:hypothetical protein